jgi:hypothetical protein
MKLKFSHIKFMQPLVEDSRRGSIPYGGCRRLRNQYSNIGQALLGCEQLPRVKGVDRNDDLTRLFHQEVAFIPTEVLESYLDDLLNLGRTERELYITPEKSCLARRKTCGLVAAVVVAAVFLGTWMDGYLALAVPVAVALGAIFSLLWIVVPYSSMSRRIKFAQIVSQEVTRRRGGAGASQRRRLSTRQVLEQLLSASEPEQLQGAARGSLVPGSAVPKGYLVH